MKKHIPLLAVASLTFIPLTSCYMPPGGFYPPGTGINPPGGITPPPGGIVPPPRPKQLELDSFSVTSIRLHKLPLRRSGTLPWDGSLGKTKYPDVFCKVKSSGRTIANSITLHDHNPNLARILTVNSGTQKYNPGQRINVTFYDRDQKNNDLIGSYNVAVPKPARGSKSSTKLVKYRNSNGDLLYTVYFRYNWVLR